MCKWGPDFVYLKYSHGCSKTGFSTNYACFKGTHSFCSCLPHFRHCRFYGWERCDLCEVGSYMMHFNRWTSNTWLWHLVAIQLHISGTEGITAMMKSLFYSFILLPVVGSNGGTCTQLFFWALDRGCAVAVFMEWNKNIAPKWQSAL